MFTFQALLSTPVSTVPWLYATPLRNRWSYSGLTLLPSVFAGCWVSLMTMSRRTRLRLSTTRPMKVLMVIWEVLIGCLRRDLWMSSLRSVFLQKQYQGLSWNGWKNINFVLTVTQKDPNFSLLFKRLWRNKRKNVTRVYRRICSILTFIKLWPVLWWWMYYWRVSLLLWTKTK